MSLLNVLKIGDPLAEKQLAMTAKPVTDFKINTLKIIVADMIETMRHYQGVGLAAPQIGVSQHIIVLEVANNTRYPEADNIPLDILINPEILEFSEQYEADWEGCLSIPERREQITRPSSICYKAFNLAQEQVIKTVSGFHARIIQHEVDHLNGILYTQHLDGIYLQQ